MTSNIEQTKSMLEQQLALQDEIVMILRRTEVTLELIEQSVSVLVWQGMPFWRRWVQSWREARETIKQQEDEGLPLGHNPQETEGSSING